MRPSMLAGLVTLIVAGLCTSHRQKQSAEAGL